MTPPSAYQAKVRRAHITREIIEVVLLIAVIFFVVHFGVQTARVPNNAMQPALQTGQLVIVNKFAYDFGAPARGDVVLINYPLNPSQQKFQRIIGIPGDHVVISLTKVTVNGHDLNEPYVSNPGNGAVFNQTLPPNQYYLLNDNRSVGGDSRSDQSLGASNGGEGLVGRDYIVGRAAFVFWPLNALHGVDSYPDTFNGISRGPLSQPLPLGAMFALPALALLARKARR